MAYTPLSLYQRQRATDYMAHILREERTTGLVDDTEIIRRTIDKLGLAPESRLPLYNQLRAAKQINSSAGVMNESRDFAIPVRGLGNRAVDLSHTGQIVTEVLVDIMVPGTGEVKTTLVRYYSDAPMSYNAIAADIKSRLTEFVDISGTVKLTDAQISASTIAISIQSTGIGVS